MEKGSPHPLPLWILLRCPANVLGVSAVVPRRPLPLAQVASSATGGAPIAPRLESPRTMRKVLGDSLHTFSSVRKYEHPFTPPSPDGDTSPQGEAWGGRGFRAADSRPYGFDRRISRWDKACSSSRKSSHIRASTPQRPSRLARDKSSCRPRIL